MLRHVIHRGERRFRFVASRGRGYQDEFAYREGWSREREASRSFLATSDGESPGRGRNRGCRRHGGQHRGRGARRAPRAPRRCPRRRTPAAIRHDRGRGPASHAARLPRQGREYGRNSATAPRRACRLALGPARAMGIDAHRGLARGRRGRRGAGVSSSSPRRPGDGSWSAATGGGAPRARAGRPPGGPVLERPHASAAPLAETHGVVLWNHAGRGRHPSPRHRMVVGIPTPASRTCCLHSAWATGGPVVILHRAARILAAVARGASRGRRRAGPCASSPIPRRVRARELPRGGAGKRPGLSWPPGGSPTTSRSPARSGAAGSSCRPRSSPRACAPSVSPRRRGRRLRRPDQWEPTAPLAPDLGPTPHAFAAASGPASADADYPALRLRGGFIMVAASRSPAAWTGSACDAPRTSLE